MEIAVLLVDIIVRDDCGLAVKYLMVFPLPLLMRVLAVDIWVLACDFLIYLFDIHVPYTDHKVTELSLFFKLFIQIIVVLQELLKCD